jgi:hypothetical protein
MSDQISQDQLDFYGRLLADAYFADVEVLLEAKGLTEADVDQALGPLNEKGGKSGACVVVLMPTLTPESPDAPGPRFLVRQGIQVIEAPLFNRVTGGTGKSAAAIAEQVRRLCHHFSTGRGNVYTFAAQEPIAVQDGKVSYAVTFQRPGGDTLLRKVATPTCSTTSSTAPATVTLACATGGAAIHYTLDGSYPSSTNPSALLYSTPVEVATAATVRAAASLSAWAQSNVSAIAIA